MRGTGRLQGGVRPDYTIVTCNPAGRIAYIKQKE